MIIWYQHSGSIQHLVLISSIIGIVAYSKPSHSVATIVRDNLTDIGLCEKSWNSVEQSEDKITEKPVSNLKFILVLATPRIFEKFLFSS